MPEKSQIYYHLSNSGNNNLLPVVLIHGAGGNHLFWPSEIRRMSGFRIFAPDLPGHGRSKGHGLQDVHKYAEKIQDWMDSIKLNRAVFIGHSMGGAIALTLAHESPNQVLGLGLISTGARLRVHPKLLENSKIPQSFPTAVSSIVKDSFSSHASPRLVILSQKRMKEIRPSVLYGDLLACDRFDLIDSISQIKSPTLVVCGQDDQMTPPRYSHFLVDQIQDSELQIIPDAGHMVMLEQPQLVEDILKAFLNHIPFQPWLLQSQDNH